MFKTVLAGFGETANFWFSINVAETPQQLALYSPITKLAGSPSGKTLIFIYPIPLAPSG